MKKEYKGETYELVDQNSKVARCCDGCDVSSLNICSLFRECIDNLNQVWKIVKETPVQNLK